MRTLTVTACLVLLAATDGSALAQSCGKGMLWPYVRQAGDCLTDDEIRAGQRGVYSGPLNTNPDMSGVKVETPAQSTGVTGTSGPPSGAGGASSPASAGTPLFGGGLLPPVSESGPGFGAGFTPAPAASSASCSKGWLWPFVRNPGDCLTDAEKANGQAGVYRAEQVVTAAAPAGGVTQVSAVPSSGVATPAGRAEPPPAAEPACRKGWLWPFVRRPGDCPTDAERRSSK